MNIKVRAIIIKDNKVLLMHRVRAGLVYWAFPGGGVEEIDSSHQDALKRECMEELGVIVEVSDLFFEKPSDAPSALGQMEYFYNCTIVDGEVGTGTGPEWSDRDIEKYGTYKVEWLSLSDLEDKNVYPLELRDKLTNNIKLICFDLDETLIIKSSWKELGLALGISVEKDRELYYEYKLGKITYNEWNNKIVELYLKHQDSNKDGITKILSRYTYNKGAKEIVGYLKNKGYKLVLISGSIDLLVDMVAKDLGMDYSKANNTFIFDNNGNLQGVHSAGDDVLAKAEHLESICELLDIDIKECACIADGANDIEMFKRTGHGITFKGSTIESDSWKIIDSFEDLKKIF